MQTYALNLTSTDSRSFSTAGDLFVYESGLVAGDDDADLRIIVKPESGGEITLKPGQQFRLPKGESAMQWYVRAATPGTDIIGAVIIGAGEFDDANTVNTFKLDGTFTNAVKVTNTEAERVPVSLDPKQFIQNAAPIMAFTNSKTMQPTANTMTMLIDPASNVGGIVVESFYTSSTQSSTFFNTGTVAKQPTNANMNIGDGWQIVHAVYPGFTGETFKVSRVKLPPGYGLWVLIGGGWTVSINWTVL